MPVRKGTTSRNHGVHRARPARVFCGEKYACSMENAEAVFRCDQCATNQCCSCEIQLHQVARYRYHDRQKLPEPLPDALCEQAAVGSRCFPKNFADVVCIECGHRRYCVDCDAALHRARMLSKHTRISILSELHRPSVTPSSLADEQTSMLLPTCTSGLSMSADVEDSSLYISLPSIHSETSEAAGEAVTVNRETELATDAADVDVANDSNRTAGAVLSVNVEKSCSAACCYSADNNVDSLGGSVILPLCEMTVPSSFLLLSEREELMVSDFNFN